MATALAIQRQPLPAQAPSPTHTLSNTPGTVKPLPFLPSSSSSSSSTRPKRRSQLPVNAFGRLPDDAPRPLPKSLLRRSLTPTDSSSANASASSSLTSSLSSLVLGGTTATSTPTPTAITTLKRPPMTTTTSSPTVPSLGHGLGPSPSLTSSASTSLTDVGSTLSEPTPSTSTTATANSGSGGPFGPPKIPTILRSISFAPLPMTEARSCSGTLGVAGRARLLAERRGRRAETLDDHAHPGAPPFETYDAEGDLENANLATARPEHDPSSTSANTPASSNPRSSSHVSRGLTRDARRAERERVAVEDALGRLERAHASSRLTSTGIERIARRFAKGWRKLNASSSSSSSDDGHVIHPRLKLTGELRIEKTMAEPEPGVEGAEPQEQGLVWESEVSPDFMALHFRARDRERERVEAETEAREKERKEREKEGVKGVVRRASERALRRSSSMPLRTDGGAGADATGLGLEEEDSWMAQGVPQTMPNSRAQTPALAPMSMSLPFIAEMPLVEPASQTPAVVVGAEAAKSDFP